VDVAGTGLVEQNDRQWGGLGFGGALDWAGGRYSLYGEVQAKASLSRFRESHSVGGTVGFRMKW
jgi:fibronectin-binding autotransporter adhesin